MHILSFHKNNKTKFTFTLSMLPIFYSHNLYSYQPKYCIKIFPDTINSFYLLANGFFYKQHVKEKKRMPGLLIKGFLPSTKLAYDTPGILNTLSRVVFRKSIDQTDLTQILFIFCFHLKSFRDIYIIKTQNKLSKYDHYFQIGIITTERHVIDRAHYSPLHGCYRQMHHPKTNIIFQG